MGEVRDLIMETADRLFSHYCDISAMRQTEDGAVPRALWSALVDAGFTNALLPVGAGGPGLDVKDAFAILIRAGFHNLPAPLAETMLATWLLNAARLTYEGGVLTVAPVRHTDRLIARQDGSAWRITGKATRVPWGHLCDAIVVLTEAEVGSVIAVVEPTDTSIARGRNVAGESRDDVVFTNVRALAAGVAPTDLKAFHSLGAVMRSAQIAGALQRVLAISVQYARDRVQFGRPIGDFQAVQQNLAVLAGQTAAATAAAEAAIEAIADGGCFLPIASAKVRTSEAAGIGAAIAHQVHGAMGFTKEHVLHYSTRRLWSWRDEFGNEIYWSRKIGESTLAEGPDRIWQFVTASS